MKNSEIILSCALPGKVNLVGMPAETPRAGAIHFIRSGSNGFRVSPGRVFPAHQEQG